MFIVEAASGWGVVLGINPMPLIRKSTFVGVRIRVRPSRSSAYRAVVLWFEDLLEYGGSVGAEELLSHEADLVMDL